MYSTNSLGKIARPIIMSDPTKRNRNIIIKPNRRIALSKGFLSENKESTIDMEKFNRLFNVLQQNPDTTLPDNTIKKLISYINQNDINIDKDSRMQVLINDYRTRNSGIIRKRPNIIDDSELIRPADRFELDREGIYRPSPDVRDPKISERLLSKDDYVRVKNIIKFPKKYITEKGKSLLDKNKFDAIYNELETDPDLGLSTETIRKIITFISHNKFKIDEESQMQKLINAHRESDKDYSKKARHEDHTSQDIIPDHTSQDIIPELTPESDTSSNRFWEEVIPYILNTP